MNRGESAISTALPSGVRLTQTPAAGASAATPSVPGRPLRHLARSTAKDPHKRTVSSMSRSSSCSILDQWRGSANHQHAEATRVKGTGLPLARCNILWRRIFERELTIARKVSTLQHNQIRSRRSSPRRCRTPPRIQRLSCRYTHTGLVILLLCLAGLATIAPSQARRRQRGRDTADWGSAAEGMAFTLARPTWIR